MKMWSPCITCPLVALIDNGIQYTTTTAGKTEDSTYHDSGPKLVSEVISQLPIVKKNIFVWGMPSDRQTPLDAVCFCTHSSFSAPPHSDVLLPLHVEYKYLVLSPPYSYTPASYTIRSNLQ